MPLTLLVGLIIGVAVLAGLAIAGRVSLVQEIAENERIGILIRDFHEDLVAYANSNGDNQSAFQRLTMKSTEVEGALGWDNIVNGVQIGMYMLNNARLLPLALQEMRREYNDGFGWRDGGQIADVVQTVLFRHAGRRVQRADNLVKRAGRFWSCVAKGWSAVAALPISILSGFGLLNARRASAARRSLVFRLWNLLLALAAISGPVFAYLADREKIDAAIRGLLP
jgi:hypothetical protein